MPKKNTNDNVQDIILTDEEASKLKSLIKTLNRVISCSYGALVIVSLISFIGLFTSIPIIILILTGLLLILSIPGIIFSGKKAKEIQSFLKTVESAETRDLRIQCY